MDRAPATIDAIPALRRKALRIFIENLGNLVCPASYDLGESMRMVMMSVTEGEDKPLKYATIFNQRRRSRRKREWHRTLTFWELA